MNLLSDIWAGIQDYLDDWLKDTNGYKAYGTFEIDLSEAHDEKKYSFSGDQIIIEKSDSTAYIKMNDRRNDNINTTKVGSINTHFKEFYVTNEAKTGKLEILVGSKGVFGAIAGRINAIITDPEDSRGNAHQIGNAELAVRLGSIDTYDKRGNVLLSDAFESSTLKWLIATSGTGSAVSISTNAAVQGDSSCKLTSGSNGARIAAILKYIHPQVYGRLGAEFSFTVFTNTETVTLQFNHSDGTTDYIHLVVYDHTNSKLKYTGSGGTFDIATGITLESGFTTFHTMKLVIDSLTKKPVRLLVNEQSFDLSSYSPTVQGAGSEAWVSMAVYHISAPGVVNSIYIDNVIITQNEP